jgi:SAM-dependent methyltransferase
VARRHPVAGRAALATQAAAPAPGPCAACGGRPLARFADARELDAELEAARRFHAARLAHRDPGELSERAAFTQATGDAAELFACSACGKLERWPHASEPEVRRAYADDAYPEDRLDEMRASQVALFRRKVAPLRRLLGSRLRVLEVGSFVGGFLDVARTAGWPALGLDPGRQVSAFCRARGLAVHTCTLEEHTSRSGVTPVDVLAIWNTFDQLPDPRPTLALAARWLSPGGVLALRVPHATCYRMLRARWRAAGRPARRFHLACLAWNNLLGFPYLHGYTVAALDRLVEPFGFRRAGIEGDVLGVIAGRGSADWARREERALKQLQRLWIRAQVRRGRGLDAAPWLDAYYRRVAPASL